MTSTMTVELRVLDGEGTTLLVNGRPATSAEAQAFQQFIKAPQQRHREFHTAFGNPPGGIVIKTAEAVDFLN
jgi:hypothetical protein